MYIPVLPLECLGYIIGCGSLVLPGLHNFVKLISIVDGIGTPRDYYGLRSPLVNARFGMAGHYRQRGVMSYIPGCRLISCLPGCVMEDLDREVRMKMKSGAGYHV